MRVELTELARQDLDFLIRTRELPASTYDLVADALDHLHWWPHAGQALAGRHDGLRAILGPWKWLIIVYEISEPDDVVRVVGIADGRTQGAPRP